MAITTPIRIRVAPKPVVRLRVVRQPKTRIRVLPKIIPADGEDGDAATVEIGSVTTLPAGSSATVVNSGTENAAVLDFGLPAGDTGPAGEDGLIVEIQAGDNITVDATDPARPIVSSTASGDGTVTSVAMSVPTGLAVSGSPITTSGTFAVTYDTGYQGYTSDEATKLSGIEASADVTDATNVAAAGAVMDGDTDASGFGFVIDEDDMASDSATKVPTQQSVKAYVDGLIESGTWAPVATFLTPGDLSVVYTTQTGSFLRVAEEVFVNFECYFTPTYTTASSQLRLNGLPFPVGVSGFGDVTSSSAPNLITYPAGATHLIAFGADDTDGVAIRADGSNFTAVISVTQIVSGNTYRLRGSFNYTRAGA